MSIFSDVVYMDAFEKMIKASTTLVVNFFLWLINMSERIESKEKTFLAWLDDEKRMKAPIREYKCRLTLQMFQ